jgi:hypothetical protein
LKAVEAWPVVREARSAGNEEAADSRGKPGKKSFVSIKPDPSATPNAVSRQQMFHHSFYRA